MSDIKKGYTFTDKSTDWVSNKETAIRLNKMLDDAKLNLVAGTNISITPTANGPSIAATGGGTGTVTSVNLTAGTGVSVSGGPITTSGSITVNNTAPDQVVSLTGAGTTTVTGTYPSFTISSADSATGTVTSVAATAGTGITVSGSPITTSGTLTITNSAPDQTVVLSGGTGITTSGTYPSFTVTNSAPDQTVSISGGTGITTSGTYPSFTVTNSNPDQTVSLTGAGTTSITGTYPSFTVTSNDAFTGTVTSVAATAGTGITISGSPITSSGTLSITNSAPDQVVSLTGTGTTTVTGTYPSFTINSADQHVGTVTAVTGTLPIVSTGTTAPDISINAATNLLPGSMSAADKSKLDAATNANTASAIVSRDVSGNFSAGTITANLTGNVSGTSGSTTGNAATATALATARAINGVNFDGTANITVTAAGSTLSDTVPIGKGGTGQTAANAAFNALAPSQTGNSGKYLTTNGTNTSWAAVSGGAGGTVTSVSVTTANGVSGTVADPTTTPAISLSLGAITPTSVAASGTVSGSNLSGTNTGDQTITLTGGVTGSGTGSFAATVVTNANLTGPITSVGNATSVAAQTGTGSTFVMQASPTLTTPALGTPTSGLLNSCTSNPNATGAVERTFQAKAGDVFNVKDFGAVGDGSANDTTAIQAAATAAVAKISSVGTTIPFGASLYFPAGTYRIAGTLSTIVIGSTIDSDQKSLTITGDGPGVSHIFQTTNNAGFVDVELANRSGRLNVFDLSVWNVAATQLSSSAAFKISVTEPANNISHPNLDVRNVYVGGVADGSAKSFSYGFDLLNIRMGSFESTMYIGNVTQGVGVRLRGVGGTPAAANNKTIDVAFNKCRFNYCEIGFEIKDSLEGILINNCTMAGVDYGIKSDYCIHLGLSNSHINSRKNAILSTGVGAGGAVDQGNIVNNSLYSEYANVEAVKGPFVRSVICGNQFLATNNNSGTVGVRLTTGSIGNNVSGNSFAWHILSYVIVDSGATYNMVTGNMASRNVAAATTPFDNQGGATNSFTNNVNEP